MYIVAFFTNEGIPATGLTPTIKIVDLISDSVVVNGDSMTETSIPGLYKYSYTSYNNENEYGFVCDGGATLNNVDRYQAGVNDFVSITEMSDTLEDSDAGIG